MSGPHARDTGGAWMREQRVVTVVNATISKTYVARGFCSKGRMSQCPAMRLYA